MANRLQHAARHLVKHAARVGAQNEGMPIRDRLLERMTEMGINAPALGRLVGVSQSAVYQWLNGNSKTMKPSHLLAVCKALNVNEEWLVNNVGHKERSLRQSLSPEEAGMLADYAVLDKNQKEAIRNTIKNLAIAAKKSSENL
jgi:transcriptional regulator with XRE-family HTH domain